jgi:hypothetical protein
MHDGGRGAVPTCPDGPATGRKRGLILAGCGPSRGALRVGRNLIAPRGSVRPYRLFRSALTMRVDTGVLIRRTKGFKALQIATVAHLVRCVGIGTIVNCTRHRQAEKVKRCHRRTGRVRQIRAWHGEGILPLHLARRVLIGAAYSVSAKPRLRPSSAAQRNVAMGQKQALTKRGQLLRFASSYTNRLNSNTNG